MFKKLHKKINLIFKPYEYFPCTAVVMVPEGTHYFNRMNCWVRMNRRTEMIEVHVPLSPSDRVLLFMTGQPGIEEIHGYVWKPISAKYQHELKKIVNENPIGDFYLEYE